MDAESLYSKLEVVILPLYYGSRERYLDVMRHAIAINGLILQHASAWCSSILPTLTCASALARTISSDRTWSIMTRQGSSRKTCLAIENLRGFIVARQLQLKRAHAALPAKVFDFVKGQRADALVSIALLKRINRATHLRLRHIRVRNCR